MVPVALLCGCTTVAEALQHELVAPFVHALLFDDILPSLSVPDGESFAHALIDRFANPYLRHALFDITLQGTMKLRVRVVPSILGHVAATGRPPESLAFAFAAYLLFMRGELHAERQAAGAAVPADDAGETVRQRWAGIDAADAAAVAALVRDICAETALWDTDLNRVAGFAAAVTTHLTRAGRLGILRALETHLATTPSFARGS
jgi:tagaturonate reductase